MKILVTGGTGFVGSHVCRQLVTAGHQVRLLVRSADKAKSFYSSLAMALPELVVGDVTDPVSVQAALIGCEAVVHAAAATPIGCDSVERLFAVNVGGVENVMSAAVDRGLRSIVHISSITAVFYADAGKVTTTAEPTPSSMPYGQSKVEAECFVRKLQASGAPISIVYPGAIVGPDDPGLSDTFKALQYRINNGFRIIDDGGMQHIDVRDLAAFVASLAIDGGGGRYLLPGVYCTWSELADTIEEVSGCKLQRIAAKGWKLRLLGRAMDFGRRFKPIDSPVSAETMRYATLWPNIAITNELAARNLSLRSTADTFRDSLAWMLKAGHLRAEQVPKLQNTLTYAADRRGMT